jgi:hypothetical protein
MKTSITKTPLILLSSGSDIGISTIEIEIKGQGNSDIIYHPNLKEL